MIFLNDIKDSKIKEDEIYYVHKKPMLLIEIYKNTGGKIDLKYSSEFKLDKDYDILNTYCKNQIICG